MHTISLGTNRFHSAVCTNGQHAFGHVSDWVDIECQLEANEKKSIKSDTHNTNIHFVPFFGPYLVVGLPTYK